MLRHFPLLFSLILRHLQVLLHRIPLVLEFRQVQVGDERDALFVERALLVVQFFNFEVLFLCPETGFHCHPHINLQSASYDSLNYLEIYDLWVSDHCFVE